jgi:hypothetical protein
VVSLKAGLASRPLIGKQAIMSLPRPAPPGVPFFLVSAKINGNLDQDPRFWRNLFLLMPSI